MGGREAKMAFRKNVLPGLGDPETVAEPEEEPKKKDNVFAHANAIMRDADRDALDKTPKYNAYLTNRALSQHADCIFQAHTINGYPNAPDEIQFDYLFLTVPKRKRGFGKWAKGEEDSNAEIVSRYYGLRMDKARGMSRCLTQDQIDELGGRIADLPKGEYRQVS